MQGLESVDGVDSEEASNGQVLITRDAVLLPQAQESVHDKANGNKKVIPIFIYINLMIFTLPTKLTQVMF